MIEEVTLTHKKYIINKYELAKVLGLPINETIIEIKPSIDNINTDNMEWVAMDCIHYKIITALD